MCSTACRRPLPHITFGYATEVSSHVLLNTASSHTSGSADGVWPLNLRSDGFTDFPNFALL